MENVATGPDAAGWIALDLTAGKMYWTTAQATIRRANLDGSAGEDLVTRLVLPIAIALELYPPPPCSKIRFVTETGDTITTANKVMSHYFMSGKDGTLNIMVIEPPGFVRTSPDIQSPFDSRWELLTAG